MRLVSYNIRYGGTGREGLLAEVLRAVAADLVVLQEATDTRVIERLAEASGMGNWGARAGHSLAFMARAAGTRAEWRWPPSSRHAYLELDVPAWGVRVIGVHLRAIHAAWTERARLVEARALLAAIAGQGLGPHVLVGDFNTLGPGQDLDMRRLPPRLRPFIWLSGGRVRWKVVQALIDAGYEDVYRRLHPGDEGYTFPTWDPHLRLDFAFTPAGQVPEARRCEVVSDPEAAVRLASDHKPLLIEFA